MDRHDPDAAMVLLPADAGTEVHGLDVDGRRAAVLCGDAVVSGELTGLDSWQVVCPGGLGAPTPCDDGVHRIWDWDEWGGPETEDSEAYMRLLGSFGNPLERAARGLHRPETEADARALGELVRAPVTEVLPEPPDQDPWHGPTAAAAEVAWLAGQVRSHAALGWPMPDDLQATWAWLEAGHWPCALRGDRLRVF